MLKISAVIITFNEEENIRAACESVRWADEIVVVDSESSDGTRDIAASCGAKVIVNKWPGFAAQKQFATNAAINDWVFSLDADERVSPELLTSIEAVRSETDRADGYRIARRTFYMNRWIRGGGWYPDYQLRFFNRTQRSWGDRLIHESFKLKAVARIETLIGDLLHYTVRDLAQHQSMIEERYAPLGAQQMLREGKQTSSIKAAISGPSAFIRSYLFKGGFCDRGSGLNIRTFGHPHASLKHKLLLELQNSSQEKL